VKQRRRRFWQSLKDSCQHLQDMSCIPSCLLGSSRHGSVASVHPRALRPDIAFFRVAEIHRQHPKNPFSSRSRGQRGRRHRSELCTSGRPSTRSGTALRPPGIRTVSDCCYSFHTIRPRAKPRWYFRVRLSCGGARAHRPLIDDAIMASTDAVWLSLFFSEGSTLEATGPSAQACSQESWAPTMS
jgi:hypothetical protein